MVDNQGGTQGLLDDKTNLLIDLLLAAEESRLPLSLPHPLTFTGVRTQTLTICPKTMTSSLATTSRIMEGRLIRKGNLHLHKGNNLILRTIIRLMTSPPSCRKT